MSALEMDGFSSFLNGNNSPLPHAVPFSKFLVERQEKRSETLNMNEIGRVLNIKKNMVILDIGTGSGQNAYKFARLLDGTGEVFATDINPDMINYVKVEAEKRHLKNLTPVLVKADGVDDFYTRHKYDLIFIAHTMRYIPDFGNFLTKMKRYLNAKGHLVVLTYKYFANFNLEDFTDVNGLLKQILKEQPKSPFYIYLGPLQPEAKRILAGGNLKRNFLFQIVRCFNKMAQNGGLFVPFIDTKKMVLRDNLRIPLQESVFINFNFIILKENGTQDKHGGVDSKSPFLNNLNSGIMHIFNQIIILSEFQKFMY